MKQKPDIFTKSYFKKNSCNLELQEAILDFAVETVFQKRFTAQEKRKWNKAWTTLWKKIDKLGLFEKKQ